jgi:hypothetical protein
MSSFIDIPTSIKSILLGCVVYFGIKYCEKEKETNDRNRIQEQEKKNNG